MLEDGTTGGLRIGALTESALSYRALKERADGARSVTIAH